MFVILFSYICGTMKKYFKILLSLLVSSYLLLVPFVALITQFIIHHQNTNIQHHLKKKKILITTLDKSTFDKLCSYDKKEILIDHHLYDIISYQYINKKVILKLYKDTEETHLLNILKIWMKNQKKSEQNTLFFSINAPVENDLKISPNWIYTQQQKNLLPSPPILNGLINHTTPPPKV